MPINHIADLKRTLLNGTGVTLRYCGIRSTQSPHKRLGIRQCFTNKEDICFCGGVDKKVIFLNDERGTYGFRVQYTDGVVLAYHFDTPL